MRQIEFLKKESKAYGGELLKTRKGRSAGRPLDTRNTMHLVLRSSKAKGTWSFKRPHNESKIRGIVDKFSGKYGIKILSLANVGNHLHFQIKLSNRYGYKPFIRAVTASIAMAVTGVSRWNKDARGRSPHSDEMACIKSTAAPNIWRFWDYRPFTRVVHGFRAFLNLRDYLQVNQLEGLGATRIEARFLVASRRFQTAFADSG